MTVTQQFSILYVEDDQPARDILCCVLTRKYSGNNIYVAENGEIGLEMFRKYLPEIVITDINMPQMDGNQLSFEIRSIRPNTGIVATSAHSSVQSLLDSKESGISYYIQKPVIYSELFDAIDRCATNLGLVSGMLSETDY